MILGFIVGMLVGCGQAPVLSGDKDSDINSGEETTVYFQTEEDVQRNEEIKKNWDFAFSSSQSGFALNDPDDPDNPDYNNDDLEPINADDNEDPDVEDTEETKGKGKGKGKDKAREKDLEKMKEILEEPSEQDLAKCGEGFPEGAKLVKVTGNENRYEASLDAVYVIRLAGNQSVADLHIGAVSDEAEEEPSDAEEEAPEAEVAGLCLILNGNQVTANVSLYNGTLGNFHARARGNQAEVNLEVAEGSEVKSTTLDFKGNKPTINMSGSGKYDCTAEESHGKIVNCQ